MKVFSVISKAYKCAQDFVYPEQIVAAVRANNQGGSVNGLSAQQVINQINRQAQMFGSTPIQGV